MRDNETFYQFLSIVIFLVIFIVSDYLFRKRRELYKIKIYNNANNRDERFEKIYSNIRNEDVEQLEQFRKEIKRKKMFKNIVFSVIFIASIMFNINGEKLVKTMSLASYTIAYQLSIYAIYFGIPLWILSSMYKSGRRKQYEKQYKNSLLSSFVNLYNNNFVYKSEFDEEFCKELKYDYLKNNFSIDTVGGIDMLVAENCISGTLENNTKMNLYDISLENKNDLEKDNFMRLIYKEGYTTTNLFKGTYIAIEIGKLLPTLIRISKNKFIPRKNKVELDSSEFEKYFDVNSDDKILATRILTADVMQMLVEFYKKYHITLEIVLRENKIHINLHTGQPFKIPIYTGIDKKKIYLYYAILEFTTNLSKEINKVLNEIEL